MNNFENMDLNELLALCNENFYEVVTTPQDFFSYLCEISKRVCEEAACDEYPQVKLDNMHNIGMYYMGYQIPNTNIIALNENLVIDFFKEFAWRKNLYYVFMSVVTVIHETRHFLQENDGQDIDPIVKSYTAYKLFMTPSASKQVPYEAVPIEIDARAYAFEMLKGIPLFFQYFVSDIWRERDALRKKSSVARSINETYQNMDFLERKDQIFVYKMNKAYSKFLQINGLDRSDFELPPTITQPEALNGDPENADLIVEIAEEMAEFIEDLDVSTKGELKESLKKTDEVLKQSYPFLTDKQRQEVSGVLRVDILSRYESEKLYERIAPGFYKLMHCTHDGSDLPEIDTFWAVFGDQNKDLFVQDL